MCFYHFPIDDLTIDVVLTIGFIGCVFVRHFIHILRVASQVPYALHRSTMSVLKILLPTPLGILPYDGKECVYVLTGLIYRKYVVVHRVVEVPNVSSSPEKTFAVLKSDVSKVKGSLTPPEIVLGYAHTHPYPYYAPSFEDIEGIATGMIGLVVCNDSYEFYNNDGLIATKILR